ncbi:MAG: type II secretion system major pseudopilin GspG [Myxococcota bacterium]
MKTQRKRIPRKGQRGLTLIEILVVVAILGMIAGIVGITVANQLGEARVDTAKVQIKNIGDALELYKVKFNKYPTTAEGLDALASPPEGRKPLMETIPSDPFGNDYLYVYPGTRNQSKFDLYSKGPDGTADTEDDITNWKR